MIQPLKYQAVNWIDGMKLSKNHFEQNSAFHTDSIRDLGNLLLTDHNYGLLPPMEHSRTSLEYDLNPHSDRFEITLRSCNAITRGGVRIYFSTQQGNNHESSGKEGVTASIHAHDYENQEETRFAVVVTANPFQRIPVGAPDPEESPLRHPFSTPTLHMEIIPEAQINLRYAGGYHFIIGKIHWKDKRFSWVDRYIPPCMVSAAHADLKDAHKEFNNLYNGLRTNSITIMKTIYKEEFEGRPSYNPGYGKNTGKLCQQVLNYLTTTAFSFKNTALYASPIHLVEQASGLAAAIYTTLNLIPENEKEQLLGYYAQWTGIQPIEFLESLSEMVDLHYQHGDLAQSVFPAQRFVRVVAQLWEKLGTLKFMGENERSLVLGIERGFKNRRTSNSDILD